MAKSDLLKQAIADANAVKETALANAKIALQEAFAPRLERMLATRMSEELEDEDEAAPMDTDMGAEATGEETMGDFPDSVNVGLDFNDDGEYDLTGMVGGTEEEMPTDEMPAEDETMSDEDANAEYNEGYGHEDLDEMGLDEIIRELEEDLEGDGLEGIDPADPAMQQESMKSSGIGKKPKSLYEEEDGEEEALEEDIDAIIEAILREEEGMDEPEMPETETAELQAELEDKEEKLEEAYRTVKKLTSIINEVNLLNAKLLYTNKLFRNFELSEGQKMKVIENFDRAGNTREVKLVFSTLAESFKRPETKKRVVKESYASKATQTTAPKTNTILNEGFELADRWKKLAGLL